MSSHDLNEVHHNSSKTARDARAAPRMKSKPHLMHLCCDFTRPVDTKHNLAELTDVPQHQRHLDEKSKELLKPAQPGANPRDFNLPAGLALPAVGTGGYNMDHYVAESQQADAPPAQNMSSSPGSSISASTPHDRTGHNQFACDHGGWSSRGHRLTFRHPYFRAFVATFIAVLNFYIYAEDPIAHSRVEAQIPIIGQTISMLFLQWPSTDQGSELAFRTLFTAFLLLSGMVFGRQIVHHKLLRDRWRLKMFAHSKGTWMIMFWTVIVWMWLGSYIYNAILKSFSDDDSLVIDDKLDSGNDTFMKVAASLTWMGDYITAYMVIDMMLQDNEYPEWAIGPRSFYKGNFRVILFWFLTSALCAIVISFIATDFINWDEYGDRVPWTIAERGRAVLAAVITLFDLLIVMQDWEFPTFHTNQSVNLPGLFTYQIKFDPPAWLNWFSVHVTGKWFNYGIIFIVMMLDLNMLKNQVVYEPDAYAQYVGPDDHIWTIENMADVVAQQLCWQDQLPDASCAALYTFDARQAARDAGHDVRMNSQYLGYSNLTMGSTIIPALIGGLLFFTLFYLENPKRAKTMKHLVGVQALDQLNRSDTFSEIKNTSLRRQATSSTRDSQLMTEEDYADQQQRHVDRESKRNMPAEVVNFYGKRSKDGRPQSARQKSKGDRMAKSSSTALSITNDSEEEV